MAEHNTVRYTPPMTAERMTRVELGPIGQQGTELVPGGFKQT
jgi:hypothetical protein